MAEIPASSQSFVSRGIKLTTTTYRNTHWTDDTEVCGRYRSRAEKQQIAEEFRVRLADALYFCASYNIAPQTIQPVVRMSEDRDGRELVLMRWELAPFWSKDGKAGYSTINARAETITTSPALREAFRHRRCLVPADGFCE